jgi:hypothetical protein
MRENDRTRIVQILRIFTEFLNNFIFSVFIRAIRAICVLLELRAKIPRYVLRFMLLSLTSPESQKNLNFFFATHAAFLSSVYG